MKSPFLDGRERLFENEIGFVIKDNFAVSEGHLLIVPHREYSNYFEALFRIMNKQTLVSPLLTTNCFNIVNCFWCPNG